MMNHTFKASNSGHFPDQIKLDQAESIALRAVAFLAADEDALLGLLRLTGLDLEGLKTNLGDRATLAGVLTVLLENETRLLAFCEAENLPPTAPAAAYRRLSPPLPNL